MFTVTRRSFITKTLTLSIATCSFLSRTAWAEWSEGLFTQKSKSDVLNKLFGKKKIEPSPLIKITSPEIAENGAVVPISIQTSLPNVESISIIVDKNPRPLAANFEMHSSSGINVGTRIRLAEKSDVTAIIKSNGKLYSSTKYIKVTKGGCGGG